MWSEHIHSLDRYQPIPRISLWPKGISPKYWREHCFTSVSISRKVLRIHSKKGFGLWQGQAGFINMCSAWFKCLLKKKEKINMRLYITIAPLWLLPSILWCSTQLPSLPMLPRILSLIVPLCWWCLQSNNYDHDPFMSCAAAFCVVTQCSSLVLDLLSSAINKQQAFFSQSQR